MAYRTKPVTLTPIRSIRDIRREDTQLTAQDVAFRAHIAISTYNKIEQGVADLGNITLNTFINIAHAFDYKPSEFLQLMGLDTENDELIH